MFITNVIFKNGVIFEQNILFFKYTLFIFISRQVETEQDIGTDRRRKGQRTRPVRCEPWKRGS